MISRPVPVLPLRRMKMFAVCMTIFMLAAASASAALRLQPPSATDEQPPVSPAEVQRMFDAYALVQAQDQLKLNDDQFPQFLARFKTLQELRRRSQAERARALRDLNELSRQEKVDEGELRNRLQLLQAQDARAAVDIKKAYDAVDQVLDVRQQVKFRLFEEVMERRKIELVTRARQNNRPRNKP